MRGTSDRISVWSALVIDHLLVPQGSACIKEYLLELTLQWINFLIVQLNVLSLLHQFQIIIEIIQTRAKNFNKGMASFVLRGVFDDAVITIRIYMTAAFEEFVREGLKEKTIGSYVIGINRVM